MVTWFSTLVLYSLIRTCRLDDTQSVRLDVDLEKVVAEVRKDFLSVSLDTHLIQLNWENLNFESPYLQRLARSLAPAILRVGGTSADSLYFKPGVGRNSKPTKHAYKTSSCSCGSEVRAIPDFNMTPLQWKQLTTFAKKVGWTLLFDLNALDRRNGSWTGKNAKLLFDYASNVNGGRVHWQLGNEPDILPRFFNRSIKASSLAKDYIKLEKMLKEYKSFEKSLVIGPEITNPSGKLNFSEPMEYLRSFLKSAEDGVDVVSWHHYSFDGRSATVEDFVNSTHFNRFREQARLVVSETKRVLGGKQKSVWLSETGDGWGGGTKNISDSFYANFLWLDKLGVAAQEGVQVVVKQSFYHGCYGLLNVTLQPTPVYWASVLHKRLVGTKVFNVTYDIDNVVRFYAHCGNRKKSITLFGINLNSFEVKISFEGSLKKRKFRVFKWTENVMIAKFQDMQKSFEKAKTFIMSPRSIAFVKFRNVKSLRVC